MCQFCIFTRKSRINLLLKSKIGIAGIFLLYENWFNFDQYVLGVVLGSLTLLVILSMNQF